MRPTPSPQRRVRRCAATRLRASRPAWRARADGALDLLAPARCAGCRSRLGAGDRTDPCADVFCPACLAQLDLDAPDRPLRPLGRVAWPVYAPLPYLAQGEAWLRRIKYPARGLAGLDPAARALVAALARRTAGSVPRPDVIVPVPMHPGATRRRGFDPALRWARALGRATGAPVCARALSKRRETRPQKGLGIRARRENVRHAFRFDPRRGSRVLAAGLVWLVDDVVTTGATLEACIDAFGSAGLTASGVAVCIAHTPRLLRDAADGSA